MRNLFILILFLTGGSALAQSDVIINTVTLCIAEGRYNDAEKYLDSLLREDPKSIDALMMKGNVLLNYEIIQTPPLNIISTADESIYSEELAGLKNPTVLISKDKALKIEKLWDRCIDMDSGRLDIREGLCTLYGMADMKKELLGYLPVIAKAGKIKGDNFIYTLIQYGQLLSDRGDKEGEYEVYKKIAALYPGNNSIWCELARAYHQNGDLVNAKLYADKAFASQTNPIGCEDALDLYSLLGEYTKTLSRLKVIGKDSAHKYYPFAKSLYKYAHHDNTWKKEMESYVKQFSAVPDSDIVCNVAAHMLSPGFKDDYSGFLYLLSQPIGDHFYSGLILEKAMHDFKDSISPYMIAAQINVSAHNYTQANKIYASMEKVKMSDELKKEYKLQYAYSLYCAKDHNKAIALLNELHKISTPNLFPVTYYFLGQCQLKIGNRDKGVSYFQAVINSKDESKYAYLAKLQLEKSGVK